MKSFAAHDKRLYAEEKAKLEDLELTALEMEHLRALTYVLYAIKQHDSAAQDR